MTPRELLERVLENLDSISPEDYAATGRYLQAAVTALGLSHPIPLSDARNLVYPMAIQIAKLMVNESP